MVRDGNAIALNPGKKKKMRQIANSERNKQGKREATAKPIGTTRVFFSVETPFLPKQAPILTPEAERALHLLTGEKPGPPADFQAVYTSLSRKYTNCTSPPARHSRHATLCTPTPAHAHAHRTCTDTGIKGLRMTKQPQKTNHPVGLNCA
jgi:hypothetical protein